VRNPQGREPLQRSGRSFSPAPRFALLIGAAVLVLTFLASTSYVGAVVDSEELGQFGSEGAGAGQFFLPRGMASDPVTGHLYVADSGNRRIDVFTAWGEFVSAWGWGVADGASEPETCTTTCLKGLAGSGKGQFAAEAPSSVAVDGGGGVYVLDNENRRVQKFDSAGQFILMFGGGVNKTTGGDVCTEASGDECQSGTAGSGQGELSSSGRGVAVNQAGTVLVGDIGRVQEFESDGDFKSEFKVPGTVKGVAADPTGSDVYVILGEQDDVHRFNSAGSELLPPLKVHEPGAIAVDPDGNLYAAQERFFPPDEAPQEVIEFDAGGAEVSSCCVPALFPGEPENGSRFGLTGLATNSEGDLYVANRSFGGGLGNYITFFGPAPQKWPAPKAPPTIAEQYLASAGSTSAILKARINPNFWADTRYFVEYGPAACASSPCTSQPASPGAELGSGVVKKLVTTSGLLLSGLAPNTTYHYRFVAQSGGGGPVFGPDSTFTTFSTPPPPEICAANEAFRSGAAKALPDCRAYEMVSPVDKDNGDIIALPDITGWSNRLNQAALDGEALTYSSYRAFGAAEGAPYTAQYLARRGSTGWGSEALGAPLTGNFYGTQLGLENEFKAFSPDLCDSWLVPGGGPTLAPGAVAGFPNLYRRQNCPKSYQALSTVQPPGLAPKAYAPDLQGHSADGSKAIFRVSDKLSEDARAAKFQVYEASGGALKYVCIFPAGTSAKAEAEFPSCSAGSPGDISGETSFNRTASVSHAISADGSRIYWSASEEPTALGKIYLRLDGTETLAVSETQTTKPAQFWGADPDGSKALFEVRDPNQKSPTPKDKDLYLYDLSTESSSLIAGKVVAVAAVSEDLSRVYLISEEVLAGTTGATAGENNLYLHEEGGNAFIATLSGEDVGQSLPSNGSTQPVFHVARATPDGGALAFVSTRPLTGADNADAQSGEADSEVFSYEAASGELACASCSPAGARPDGRNIVAQGGTGFSLPTAAAIPAGENQLYTPRALSDDGTHLFFTSYTDLLPADANGRADVYEWEPAGSSASCRDEADPDYYAANGGCLFLISSGQSERDSELLDSSPSGRDVFFATEESLLAQDPGLIDVYDARAGGGFPPPPPPPARCEGEACQPAAAPSSFHPPASSAPGPGNPKPISCAKGRHRALKKGREVCLKDKKPRKHNAKKKAHKNRRIAK
jgi:DNA-binding beta-propeller fold protein YncE